MLSNGIFDCCFDFNKIVDWYESQWWLNTTKNAASKWKSANSAGRNRTKVYIYPSFGHFDEIDVPKTTVRTTTTTVNSTIPDEDTLIILPGTRNTHVFNSRIELFDLISRKFEFFRNSH